MSVKYNRDCELLRCVAVDRLTDERTDRPHIEALYEQSQVRGHVEHLLNTEDDSLSPWSQLVATPTIVSIPPRRRKKDEAKQDEGGRLHLPGYSTHGSLSEKFDFTFSQLNCTDRKWHYVAKNGTYRALKSERRSADSHKSRRPVGESYITAEQRQMQREIQQQLRRDHERERERERLLARMEHDKPVQNHTRTHADHSQDFTSNLSERSRPVQVPKQTVKAKLESKETLLKKTPSNHGRLEGEAGRSSFRLRRLSLNEDKTTSPLGANIILTVNNYIHTVTKEKVKERTGQRNGSDRRTNQSKKGEQWNGVVKLERPLDLPPLDLPPLDYSMLGNNRPVMYLNTRLDLLEEEMKRDMVLRLNQDDGTTFRSHSEPPARADREVHHAHPLSDGMFTVKSLHKLKQSNGVSGSQGNSGNADQDSAGNTAVYRQHKQGTSESSVEGQQGYSQVPVPVANSLSHELIPSLSGKCLPVTTGSHRIL